MSEILTRLETAILADVADKSNNPLVDAAHPPTADSHTRQIIVESVNDAYASRDPVDQAFSNSLRGLDVDGVIARWYPAIWDLADHVSQKAELDKLFAAPSFTLPPEFADQFKSITVEFINGGMDHDDYNRWMNSFKKAVTDQGKSAVGFEAFAERCLEAARAVLATSDATATNTARTAAMDGVMGATSSPSMAFSPWLLIEAQETASVKTEQRIQNLIADKINIARMKLDQAYRTYLANSTEDNRIVYETLDAELRLYQGTVYADKVHAENYSQIYSQELERAKNDIVARDRALVSRFIDGYVDKGALSFEMAPGRSLPAFHETYTARFFWNLLDDDRQYFSSGLYGALWFGLPNEGYEIELPLYDLEAGTSFGGYGRVGVPGGKFIYPSLTIGAGFDPLRTVGGLIFGFGIGVFNGFYSGLEASATIGVNVGPVGIHGGVNPRAIICPMYYGYCTVNNTLQTLNPIITFEFQTSG